MPTSDNGWPVLNIDTTQLTTVHVGGASFRVHVDAAREFQALLEFLNKLEPFSLYGYDGGFARRAVRGSTSAWSCHASGTAVDVNAALHPRGGARFAGWGLVQRIKISAWLRLGVGRCFKWGSDFSGTPDAMHFQLRERQIWRKYRASTRVAAKQSTDKARIAALQLALSGLKADGGNGPATTKRLLVVRAEFRNHPEDHQTGIRNVQKALGLKPVSPATWKGGTDKALRKLGFNIPSA